MSGQQMARASRQTQIQLQFSLTHESLICAQNANRIFAVFKRQPGLKWRIVGKPGLWVWQAVDGGPLGITMQPRGTVRRLCVDALRLCGDSIEIVLEH